MTLGPAWSIGALIDSVSPTAAGKRGDRLAVAPDRDDRRLAGVVGVEDAGDDRLVLADDAEARRFDEFDAAVALALMAGDQHVQRGVEAERLRRTRECRGRCRR